MGRATDAVLQFRVLGPLEVLRGGVAVQLGGERQRALLALLLVHANELMRTTELVEQLFADQRSPSVVRVAISRLRRVLCDSEGIVLHTRAGGYVLNVGFEQLDATVFERLASEGSRLLAAGEASRAAGRLREALGLWRGPALVDLALLDFLQPTIRRLEELRLLAVMERIDADLQLGRAGGLVGELEQLVVSEPLQERLRGQQMLALYQCGRQADALAAYHDARRVLVEQLGIEPGAPLRSLEQAILRQDPALDVTPGTDRDQPTRSLAGEPALHGDVQGLLERVAELAAIERVVCAAQVRDGGLLTVTGPAGIGKSALLDSAREHARSVRVRVAAARASYLERSFAFGVVRQLLEPVVARLGVEERARLFRGAAEPARAVLGGEPAWQTDATFGVLHALYWVVLGLADAAPLVLVVDDVQWTDRPSLRFLVHLARRLDESAVSIVMASRTGESSDDDDLLDELRGMPLAQSLVLAPLSERAIAILVRRGLGAEADDEFCLACHRATSGNPFYLRELLRAVDVEGIAPIREEARRLADVWPASVAQHVLRRVARLGEGASDLAQAIAVLGDESTLSHAAQISRVDDADALARGLVKMAILASDAPVRFVHPIVAQAIYADLTTGRRERLHRDAARVLIEAGRDWEKAAAHLLAVVPCGEEWVIEALQAAAREAIGRGAPETAVRYLRHAVAGIDPGHDARVGLLWELGIAEEHTGDVKTVQHLEQARALCQDPGRRGEIALALARTLETRGFEAQAADVIRSALDECRALGDRDLARRLEAALLGAAGAYPATVRPGDLELYMRLTADVPVGQAGPIVLGFAAAVAAWMGAPANDAAALAEQAVARGLLDSSHWDAIGACTWALILCERYEKVASLLTTLRAAVQRRGHTRGLALVLQLQANRAERVGALPEAETSARTALELARECQLGIGSVSWIVCSLVEALVQRGELDAAAAVLGDISDWPTHLGCNATRAAKGRLHLAQGRTQEAAADLLDVGRRLEEWPGLKFNGPASTHWRSSAALALHRLDDLGQARQLAKQELESARSFGTPRALGIALRVAGIVGNAKHRLALLSESVDVLRESPALLELAHSHAALGAALRRARQRTAAQNQLRAALDLAHQCGAVSLAQFSRQELLAAGAPPRREALSGVESLTATERRIADLAAQGLTNREVAQALFITTMSVKRHLSSVYRKLSITPREQPASTLTSVLNDIDERRRSSASRGKIHER